MVLGKKSNPFNLRWHSGLYYAIYLTMSDDCKVIVVLILSIAIVLSVLICNIYSVDRAAIAGGYTQQQSMGNGNTMWIKGTK